MKKQINIKKTLMAHALTIAFGGIALSTMLPQEALAQSNAVGVVYGQVANGVGTTVSIKNLDTNATRTATPDSSGRYQVTALTPGQYQIQLLKGSDVVRTLNVEVLAGKGVDASFLAGQSVEITARRTRIDVSKSDNSVTFTAKELAKLPIGNNVDAVIQLAPNTTRADSRYAGGASFGGGGASENAYYINGFPVTNPLTQLGGSELPFGAINQAQILTGGFGAEFGRSIGGVVNITTKSGTNKWEAGALFTFAPDAFKSKSKDIYYPQTGANPTTDGKLMFRNSDSKSSETLMGGYVGGPIIEDKLFVFVAASQSKTKSERAELSAFADQYSLKNWGASESTTTTDRYLAKFDWNLTDDHRLEMTLIGDSSKKDKNLYSYDFATKQRGSQVNAGLHYKNVPLETPVGGDVQILKYTGNITNDLTVTALYGQSKTAHGFSMDGSDVYNTKAGIPQIVYNTPDSSPCNIGLPCTNKQPLSGTMIGKGAEDTVKSFRLDLEYKLGSHTIRAGLDNNKLSSKNAGDVTAGGSTWTYLKTDTPNVPVRLPGLEAAVSSGGGSGLKGYWAEQQIYNTLTSAKSDQSAQYIEDRFQVTPNVLVTAGLRNEQFTNKNGEGAAFLEMKNQIAPRLSAVWDVNGDSSTKVFGSLGRYFLQIPTHLAVRGASPSLFTTQAFTYTGVDANGAPTGLVPLSTAFSFNNEYNQPKDIKSVAALNMKPTYQDELTVGFERAHSLDLNFGVKGTYRQLKATIDDLCDPRPFFDWAAANKVNTDHFGGVCASFNPGRDNSFLIDFNGEGKNHRTVTLTAAQLGYPKAERTYTALDVFLEHPFRGGWYGKVNYTWSRSKGNTEGQTKSDNGQTDVAATSTWDFPELMENANGLLPNNRTHQIKAYGYYQVSSELFIGGNFLAASGRPKNCFGEHPTLDPMFSYGSIYFYCKGKPSPRGTHGELAWDVRLDLNLSYQPQWFKGLNLKLDVFNIANRQVAQNIVEESESHGAPAATFGRVLSYTAPRSAKISVEYNHKF